MEVSVTDPTGDDDAGDNRNERNVSEPGLLLDSHKISKHSGEEGRSRAYCLVEGHREIPKRDIPSDNGATEYEAEGRYLKKLDARAHGLHGHDAEPRNGYVAEQRAGGHVAHCEEDRVAEAIVAQKVLVEEENADVGRVPGGDEPDGEQPAGDLRWNRQGPHCSPIWGGDGSIEGMGWS